VIPKIGNYEENGGVIRFTPLSNTLVIHSDGKNIRAIDLEKAKHMSRESSERTVLQNKTIEN